MSLIPFSFWGAEPFEFLAPADYPTYGWSLWKRRSDYSGSCIRVRRSSDNTEQDIGFSGSNYLDVAAMQSFVGANTGWLVTFYDQFGSVNLTNVYVGNTNYMSRLIISGTLQTFTNGPACIPFGNGTQEGYAQLFGGSTINMVPNTNSTLFWSEENGNSVSNQIAGNSNNNSVFGLREISGVGGTAVFFDLGVVENYFVNESKLIEGHNNNISILSGELYEVASYRVSQDGAKLFAIRGIGYNSQGNGFVLGGKYDNNTTYYRGKLNEFFIYSGTTLTEAKVIEIQAVLNKAHKFYNITNMTKDLILHYDPGNTACYPGSGTAITDLSVGGAAATLVGGVTYSSLDGGKFILDGVDDWIGTSGTNNYPWNVRGGDFSIEVYVKFSNVNHSARIFGNRSAASGSGLSLAGGTIDVNGNILASKKITFTLTHFDSSRVKWNTTTDDIIDGSWKHIIATRTGNTMKVYVNGIEKALTLVHGVGGDNSAYVNTGTSWRVADGGSGTGGLGGFDIGIVRLYKCPLTQAQVTRNLNLEKSRYGL